MYLRMYVYVYTYSMCFLSWEIKMWMDDQVRLMRCSCWPVRPPREPSRCSTMGSLRRLFLIMRTQSPSHRPCWASPLSPGLIFDGSSFAKNGVVTVTVNYRLNVFGFLASSPSLEGIFGLMDQIQGSVGILPKSLLEVNRPEQPRWVLTSWWSLQWGLFR